MMIKRIEKAFYHTFLLCTIAFAPTVTQEQPWKGCPSLTPIKPLPKTCSCIKPENLGVAHNKVIEYYENGCFERELVTVVNAAKKAFVRPARHDKEVIIFDIDETVLSDYCNVKSIHFGYIPKMARKWIMKSSTPAIPAVKELYHELLNKGYHIIFLTGRNRKHYETTEKNLINQGFTGYDKIIMRTSTDKGLSAQAYKSSKRAELVKEGYDIVGCVGDQVSDLTGGNVGIPIKIPNYIYFIE